MKTMHEYEVALSSEPDSPASDSACTGAAVGELVVASCAPRRIDISVTQWSEGPFLQFLLASSPAFSA